MSAVSRGAMTWAELDSGEGRGWTSGGLDDDRWSWRVLSTTASPLFRSVIPAGMKTSEGYHIFATTWVEEHEETLFIEAGFLVAYITTTYALGNAQQIVKHHADLYLTVEEMMEDASTATMPMAEVRKRRPVMT